MSEDEELTIKSIILRHISKISQISCQEFTAGYWEKKPMRTQTGVMFSEVYHPDVRESYCNAVDFLLDIIEPSADKEFIDKLAKISEREDQEYKDAKKDKNVWLKAKVKLRRELFKEIFFLFKRIQYFDVTDVYRDSSQDEVIDEDNIDLQQEE